MVFHAMITFDWYVLETVFCQRYRTNFPPREHVNTYMCLVSKGKHTKVVEARITHMVKANKVTGRTLINYSHKVPTYRCIHEHL